MMGARVEDALRKQAFAHLQKLESKHFDEIPSGKFVSRIVSDIKDVVAFVGETGIVDGVDVTEMSLDGLRSQVTYIQQTGFMFYDTVRGNVAYGKLDATNEQVADATQGAKIKELIESLPQGYETNVGPNGTQLSGGQRQRISLARAFLKSAPIILLDEATSALDNRTEGQIQEAIEQITNKKTVITIAHRLSTIQNVDRIILLGAESNQVLDFKNLVTSVPLLSTLNASRFVTPSPIQQKLIPVLEKGNNAIASAPTGSGKTLAYLLPLLTRLVLDSKKRVLIVCPTRELARQVYGVAKHYGAALNLTAGLVTGGVSEVQNQTERTLIIGTPERILRLLDERKISARQILACVLDEADMLLDLGFFPTVSNLIRQLNGLKVQLVAVSATLSQQFAGTLKTLITKPTIIHTGEQHRHEKITNFVLRADPLSLTMAGLTLIKELKPYRGLIFVNTTAEGLDLQRTLRTASIKVGFLQAGNEMRERKRLASELNAGEAAIFIATDIAARGLDIVGITHVISLGIPRDPN
ncbi:unnamed protein product [Didymodactylos carnosus]|uniref:Uncharacterized protein n=1 Tax=Didymodactylos carnosus TaxID=1234261 RepID=A0A8S2DK28_9BILA|nr:unnamed protein product [Didymodactylos carnosus]CAF3703027.1 unnamed protein product [Didymodactylos carnosus]